jgi:hypothetical protein
MMEAGMRTSTVRAILALTVVGVFMVITGFMALYPLLSESSVGAASYAELFVKTSSVYTGIVGVIIGYYFGRADREVGKPEPSLDKAD